MVLIYAISPWHYTLFDFLHCLIVAGRERGSIWPFMLSKLSSHRPKTNVGVLPTTKCVHFNYAFGDWKNIYWVSLWTRWTRCEAGLGHAVSHACVSKPAHSLCVQEFLKSVGIVLSQYIISLVNGQRSVWSCLGRIISHMHFSWCCRVFPQGNWSFSVNALWGQK